MKYFNFKLKTLSPARCLRDTTQQSKHFKWLLNCHEPLLLAKCLTYADTTAFKSVIILIVNKNRKSGEFAETKRELEVV